MPLDLTDDDIAVLAMACRSAAHHASVRQKEARKRDPKPSVTSERFIALAERLESARTAQTGVERHDWARWGRKE